MIVFSFIYKDPPFQLIDMFVDEPIPFKELFKSKKIVDVGVTNIMEGWDFIGASCLARK